LSSYTTNSAALLIPTEPSGKPGPGEIRACFERDHNVRLNILTEARECARLTLPAELPPIDQTQDYELPSNYQSLGARGIINFVGKTMVEVFPADRLWVQQEVAAEVQYDPGVDPANIERWSQRLFLMDEYIMAALASANYTQQRGRMLGLQGTLRQFVTQVVVTGDSLMRQDDSLRLMVFRRDRYVTRRMDSGDVCYHVTIEGKDPLELTDEQLDMCGLTRSEVEEVESYERYKPLYTRTEYQPRGKNWLVEQEFNGHIFNTTEESVSSHFTAPFNLSPAEHYGRGLVEMNRGDLSSYDAMCEKTLDFAAVASKHYPIIDPSSELQADDLQLPSGSILHDRVENGQAKYLAMYQSNKLNDFSIVQQSKEGLRGDIGKVFLIGSETVRNSERTTLGEVQSVTLAELQGSTGGFYATLYGTLQLPLFLSTRYKMQRQNKIVTLPKDAVKVQVLSGIEALARQARAQKLVTFVEVIKGLEGTVNDLNMDVVMEVLARLSGVYEPGMIKTPEQKQAEQQRAIAAQTQVAAGQQAAETAGNIIEAQVGARGVGTNG
jgi:hypothetical protein